MKHKIMRMPLISLGLASIAGGLQAQQSPNIIIIYVDDMGYGDLSCYGGNITPTPNIDRLAEQGIRFTQYYSAAPVSSASRTGLTTGMYPIRHGINTFLNNRKMNRDCQQNDYLDANAPSMARTLKNAGYATAHIGKWHMGGGRDVDDAPSITEYGFDEYVSTYESPHPDPLLTSTNWIWAKSDSIKRWNRTAYFVDKTIDFLQRNRNKPCFINLWPDDVHTPWVPDKETVQNEYESKEALITVLDEMDKQIGRLVYSLEKMGLDKNTLIIFTSDNGPAPSFGNSRSGNMRGTKNSLYEGGIRMPFIVKWPERIKAGQVNQTSVVCAVDIYPTICSIIDQPLPEKDLLDGVDVSNALLATSDSERTKALYWDFGRNRYFNFPKGKNRSPHLAMREGNWKVLCNSDGSDIELYDLGKDVNETTNVAPQNSHLAGIMANKLIAWYFGNNMPRR